MYYAVMQALMVRGMVGVCAPDPDPLRFAQRYVDVSEVVMPLKQILAKAWREPRFGARSKVT
jgi:hypothetical protein